MGKRGKKNTTGVVTRPILPRRHNLQQERNRFVATAEGEHAVRGKWGETNKDVK